MNKSMLTTRTGRVGVSPACRRCATCLIAVAAMALTAASTPAQTPVAVDPDTLAQLRAAYYEQQRQAAEDACPAPGLATYWREAPLAAGRLWAGGGIGGRTSDLYVGLQPIFGDNGFWTYVATPLSIYWALDDGKMSAAAVDVGGGHVTAYEFSFALNVDFVPYTVQPCVFVTFYNAPLDPVVQASDPVVDPPSPVSSEAWLFAPMTFEDPDVPGLYAVRTGLIDLTAWGDDFDLDETFYVEVLPAKWNATYEWAELDPDVRGIFTGPDSVTVGTNQNHMWSLQWVRQDTCDNFVFGNHDGLYDHPGEMDDVSGGCGDFLNQSGIILAGTLCPGATLELTTEPDEELCLGDSVTVTLSMSCIPGLVRGYQAFLWFDTTRLEFVSGTYTASPFGLHIIDPITADGDGNIDLAAGIDDDSGQDPTSTSAVLVTLEFEALSTGYTQVEFRSHEPPTRLSDEFGEEVVPFLVNSPTIVVDVTPPDVTCPSDIDKNADAGGCDALVTLIASATDNCDTIPDSEIVFTIDEDDDGFDAGDPKRTGSGSTYTFHTGTTNVRAEATDECNNTGECFFTVTVSDKNELVVSVELSPNVDTGGAYPQTLTRCITFELWDCPDKLATIEQVLMFTKADGAAPMVASNQLVLVPCDVYTCITARDELHTLRRTDETFGIVGTQYVADFTGDPAGGGDWLIGGDLNDDGWIDILDFGVFSSQYATDYGPGDTDCDTPPPHADISGNGLVWTEDFTFIQINFLEGDEDNCCGAPGPAGGPRTRISVEELHKLGLSELPAGDLNNDGWLDVEDIEAFMLGVRPKTPVEEPDGGANKAPRSVRPRP